MNGADDWIEFLAIVEEPLAIETRQLMIDFIKKQDQLAKLGQAMQWIPVSDRLPEAGQYVDIFLKQGCRIADCKVEIGSVHYFSSENYDCTFTTSDITHWMPLPETPEVTP